MSALLAPALLAGCGGGSRASARPQLVDGPGYRFSAPAGWDVRRSRLAVGASKGAQLVEVSTFRLLKPYRAALFGRVASELKLRMDEIATQTGGTVEDAGAVTAGGVRSHVFRVRRAGEVDEYTFVLVGSREYQLLCRAPHADAAPCRQLVRTFALS